jgi:hypothetical protein
LAVIVATKPQLSNGIRIFSIVLVHNAVSVAQDPVIGPVGKSWYAQHPQFAHSDRATFFASNPDLCPDAAVAVTVAHVSILYCLLQRLN